MPLTPCTILPAWHSSSSHCMLNTWYQHIQLSCYPKGRYLALWHKYNIDLMATKSITVSYCIPMYISIICRPKYLIICIRYRYIHINSPFIVQWIHGIPLSNFRCYLSRFFNIDTVTIHASYPNKNIDLTIAWYNIPYVVTFYSYLPMITPKCPYHLPTFDRFDYISGH